VKIKHQQVPRAQFMPKLLQQASARSLPDLALIDNPDLQQLAATGGLVSLSQAGLSTKGLYPSIVQAGSLSGPDVRDRARRQRPRALRQHRPVHPGRAAPAHHLAGVEGRRAQAHPRLAPRDRVQRGRHRGGQLPVRAVPVDGGGEPGAPGLAAGRPGAQRCGRTWSAPVPPPSRWSPGPRRTSTTSSWRGTRR